LGASFTFRVGNSDVISFLQSYALVSGSVASGFLG
jgi:hypothetical protein